MKLAFIGVSLGSRRFSPEFFRRLPEFVAGIGATRLNVVVFDHAEAVNYKVFSSYPEQEAARIAALRGGEILRMIRRSIQRTSASIQTTVSSSSDDPSVLRDALGAERTLRSVRAASAEVRSRLVSEVALNAAGRLSRFPAEFREEVALAGSDYLIMEAAWAWAYFSKYGPNWEVYPGDPQPFKDRVLRGLVAGAESLKLEVVPTFVDCSVVLPTGVHASRHAA